MDCINDQIFYHIQRQGKWNKGEKYFIGNNKNRFVSYFDTNGSSVHAPFGKISYNVNFVAEEMIKYIKSGEKNSPINSFYHYDVNKTLCEVVDALNYYLKFTREIIFEEVRKDFFPHLPSRNRCIWIIPDNCSCLQYWWNTLGKTGTILKLKVNGKLHVANQQFLNLNTNRMDYIRQEAFKYWTGSPGTNKVEDECLFEGFVEIIDVINNPNDIGIV